MTVFKQLLHLEISIQLKVKVIAAILRLKRGLALIYLHMYCLTEDNSTVWLNKTRTLEGRLYLWVDAYSAFISLVNFTAGVGRAAIQIFPQVDAAIGSRNKLKL